MAPSCKLKLARFSALLRIQDGAECGNKQTPVVIGPGLKPADCAVTAHLGHKLMGQPVG